MPYLRPQTLANRLGLQRRLLRGVGAVTTLNGDSPFPLAVLTEPLTVQLLAGPGNVAFEITLPAVVVMPPSVFGTDGDHFEVQLGLYDFCQAVDFDWLPLWASQFTDAASGYSCQIMELTLARQAVHARRAAAAAAAEGDGDSLSPAEAAAEAMQQASRVAAVPAAPPAAASARSSGPIAGTQEWIEEWVPQLVRHQQQQQQRQPQVTVLVRQQLMVWPPWRREQTATHVHSSSSSAGVALGCWFGQGGSQHCLGVWYHTMDAASPCNLACCAAGLWPQLAVGCTTV